MIWITSLVEAVLIGTFGGSGTAGRTGAGLVPGGSVGSNVGGGGKGTSGSLVFSPSLKGVLISSFIISVRELRICFKLANSGELNP